MATGRAARVRSHSYFILKYLDEKRVGISPVSIVKKGFIVDIFDLHWMVANFLFLLVSIFSDFSILQTTRLVPRRAFPELSSHRHQLRNLLSCFFLLVTDEPTGSHISASVHQD
jgi:hypothetical protein